ncbi:hypothetical protein D3C81_771070 [compost metagenome]
MVDEYHHRGGARVNAQEFIIRTDRSRYQHRRPAIEQDVAGNLLAVGGNASRLGDDRFQRLFYIGAGRCAAKLAFEQGIFSAEVIDYKHAFKTAGGVQRVADVLFFVGPVQVGSAIKVFIGSIPHGVAGEELAGGFEPLLQCLVRIEATFLAFVGVQRGGDVEQCPEGNQAGQDKQCSNTGNKFTCRQAGGWAGRRNLDDPVHTHAHPW